MFDDGCDELLNRRRADVNFEDRPYDTPGTPVMVGQVYNGGSMPSVLPGYFLVHPVDLAGTESEASAAGLSTNASRSVVVLVVGTVMPVVGDYLVCRNVGTRWIAEKTGAAAAVSKVCACSGTTSPDVLHSGGIPVFGGGIPGSLYQACTFRWTSGVNPYPASLIPFPTYLSDETFTTVILGVTVSYKQVLNCNEVGDTVTGYGVHVFELPRPAHPFGFMGALYASWNPFIPADNNVCSPFNFTTIRYQQFPALTASASLVP